jgi:hypothetical protein
MRTRTLLILAVVCGLVILVAGSLQLLRVSDDSSISNDLGIGDTGEAGDLTVLVLAATEADGLMRVDVRLSGVEDPVGIDSFRLVVPGAALVALTPDQAGAGSCAALTVAEQSCELVFGTAAVDGSARVLLVRRGEDQVRWNLR